MLDIHSVRHALERQLKLIVADFHMGVRPVAVTVYPGVLETIPAFPCVVVGQPSYPTDEGPVPGLDWPIAVSVSRQEGTDHYQQSVLDELWPVVYEGLSKLADTNYNLDETCMRFDIGESDFGELSIAGKSYPAQVIELHIY